MVPRLFFNYSHSDGANRLGSQVYQHTVDTFHFVGDPVNDLVQNRVGDLVFS